MKKIAAIAAIGALAGSLSAAQSGYEVTPMLHFVQPEHNTDIKSHLAAGLRLGHYLDEYTLFDKIEAGVDFTMTEYERRVGSGERKLYIARYYVDFVKEWELGNSGAAIYGLAGLGYEQLGKKARYGQNDSLFFMYGVGFKYAFTCDWSLRAEVIDSIKTSHETGNHHVYATVGFSYIFGTNKCELDAQSKK
jgi:hypothetical protein